MSNAASYGDNDTRSRGHHGLGWVPWVALALLALILAASYLITRNATDDGDRAGVDLRNDQAGQTANAATGATGSNNNSIAANRTGVFTANGTDVLGASATQLAGLAGSQVNGGNVTVRSVVADEGFWISAGGSEQLFIHLTPQARQTQGESAPQVRAGQRVDFSGSLARVPADVSSLGINASEGASQLRSQGVFVDAISFRIR